MKFLFHFFCLFLLMVARVGAATVPTGFTEGLVASGLTSPTAMSFAPDGRLFVCQQNGQLRVIKNDVLLSTPFLTVPVDSSGERGLLGVAFDPNFAVNRFVYVYYTTTILQMFNNGLSETALTKPKAGGSLDDLARARQILSVNPRITRAILDTFRSAQNLNGLLKN